MDLPSPPNPGVGCSRYCVVHNASITVAECRSQRGSRLACLPECSHFPFGLSAYERFFRLEGAWTPKAAQYILRAVGRDRFDHLMREGALLADAEDLTTLTSGLSHAVHYGLAYEKHPAGGALADAWRKDASLTNDEEFMTRFRRHSFVTVTEVQKIIDHQHLLCTDALAADQQPFVLLDRGMAAHATVGVRLLSWLTHYPHFSRLGDMAREIPNRLWERWKQAIEELFEKDRVRETKLTLRAWLSRRAGPCADLLDTLSNERKEFVLVSDFKHRRTAYALQASPTQLLAVLRTKPDFQPTHIPKSESASALARFHWVRRGESKKLAPFHGRLFLHDAPEDGLGSLGYVQLHADRLILETFTETKFALATQLLHDYLAPLIKPVQV